MFCRHVFGNISGRFRGISRFFGNFAGPRPREISEALNYKRTVKSILLIKKFFGLVEMTFGLVYAGLSLPKWQTVKMTFFAPCLHRVVRKFWSRRLSCQSKRPVQGYFISNPIHKENNAKQSSWLILTK